MLECRNCKNRMTCDSGRELIRLIDEIGAYVTHEAIETIEETVQNGSEPCNDFEVDRRKKGLSQR